MIDDIFEDFEPPPSTDGSYKGRMKQVNETRKHLVQKFQSEFEKLKLRLKESKTRVGLTINSDAIQLQATLPLKPGDKDTNGNGKKQYKISLGIPANLDGLKTAEEEAYELGKLIARKQFQWNDKYLGRQALKKDEIKNIGELLDKFEEEYFKTHKRTTKSEQTFYNYIDCLQRYFPRDIQLTQDNIENIIYSIEFESVKHRVLCATKVLITTFRLNVTLNIKLGSYTPKNERYIPSDSEIEKGYNNFYSFFETTVCTNTKYQNNWKIWRWVYGMIATYGLRPREVINNPDLDWWLNEENTENTFRVNAANKTGKREVFPLYPDWVNKFDLKNRETITYFADYIADKSTHLNYKVSVGRFSAWMKKIGLKFTPYDLRHAWAIRAHLLGIPIKAAADNLGHTPEIHTKAYQRWFSLDNRKRAINEALAKKSEVEELRAEVGRLKLENEKLKIELERYKLNMSTHL